MKSFKISVCLLFAAAVVSGWLCRTSNVIGQTSEAQLYSPLGVTASDASYSNKVEVSWEPVRGATRYRVFRNSVNDQSTSADIGTSVSTRFFDNSAAPNQTFFYWVRAENNGIFGPVSSGNTGSRTGTPQQGPVPPLQPPPVPTGNQQAAAKIYLGKALFWDEQLSSTRTVSCGTCHHSGSGGTDPRTQTLASGSFNPGPDLLMNTPDDIRGSAGVPSNNIDGKFVPLAPYGLSPQVTGRKSISYLNAGYSPVLFWDGRATGTFRDPLTNAVVLNNGGALESQVAGPPVSSAEMAHNGRDWNDVAARVAALKPLAISPSVPAALNTWIGGRNYADLFHEAFGTREVSPSRIALSIAAFERSLYTDRTPFDLDADGIAPLTPQEQRGRNIFNASSCNVCHAGNLFSDNSFRYIGVRPQTDDLGRFDVTNNPPDRGAFRVPSLRNVELRSSFFHNGQFTTLEQVVAFYNRGGDFNAPNKPGNLIRPLGLNPQQQTDLVAFLRRPLTDPRVAVEASPFDRPMLFTESARVPQIIGSGRAGSGGSTPDIIAVSPPIAGNPNFTVSVARALGNSNAVLVIDSADPGVGTSIPTASALARIVTFTSGSGSGEGWASVSLPIPDTADRVGQTYYARWYVNDPDASNGFSVTPAARFTIFGESGTASNFVVSGKILTSDGRPLRSAAVTITDPLGASSTVVTSSLGFYQFDGLNVAGNYIITVSSKRYRFSSRTVGVSSDVTDVDLIGQE